MPFRRDLMREGIFDRLPAVIECLLFASPDPLTPEKIAQVLEVEESWVQEALRDLQARYIAEERGLQIVQVAGGYQLRTHPDFSPYVHRLLSSPPQKLSRSALEVLAIVAYRQPVTLAEIEAIRGVDSSKVVKALQERQLLQEVERKEAPGRPILYGTTDQFLRYFGLKSLSDLPPLEDLDPQEESS
jgi:segregation and condensation protein B